jgi:hypothetical protein
VSDDFGTFDTAQLAALSHRLGIPARQLLIAAMRLAQAEPERAADPAYRKRVLLEASQENAAAEASARLLLTPLSDYAIDEVDRLFAGIWPETARGQDA